MTQTKTLDTVEDYVQAAHEKLGTEKISELARYIPEDKGFAIHHLTLNNLKRTKEKEFKHLIQTHIIDTKQPTKYPTAPRNPRAPSGKYKVNVALTKSQVNRVLAELRDKNNPDIQDVLNALQPHQSFSQIQKYMTRMIRDKEADENLWNTYADMVKEKNS